MDVDRIKQDIYIPSEEDIKNQTVLVGSYMVCYEQISAIIRSIILKICYPNSSSVQNNNIEILLEGLTADPLRKKLEALVYDNFKDEEDLLRLNKELSKKFEKLIPIRNSIAHGVISLCCKGFDGELSSSTFGIKHSKITKSGIDRNAIIVNLETLEKLVRQTRQIANAYHRLSVITNDDIPIANKELHLGLLKNEIGNIGIIKFEFERKLIK